MTHRVAVALTLVAALVASPAAALRVEGVDFPERLEVQATPLVLNGAALLRYRIFIKAYVAGLYLGEGVPPARVLEDVPRRLEIQYFWAIEAEGFADATDEGIARNVDDATFAALRPRIDRLNTLYRDVEPGDRYALTYLPGSGTELSLNGAPLGRIEGADFAAAVFSIWLGKAPLDESLKRRLLGGD